jgi:TRAP-type C4-dicarboxylate transport system substrate-binding protein
VQKYCALSNHCWSGYWIVGNRRALAGLPADLMEIVNRNFDAGHQRARRFAAMDRSLQADLTAKGMTPRRAKRGRQNSLSCAPCCAALSLGINLM